MHGSHCRNHTGRNDLCASFHVYTKEADCVFWTMNHAQMNVNMIVTADTARKSARKKAGKHSIY